MDELLALEDWSLCMASSLFFFEVIALVIILFVVGLVAPHVLVVASRAIVAPIVLMTIIGSSIIAVASVALMIIAIFATAMLRVA